MRASRESTDRISMKGDRSWSPLPCVNGCSRRCASAIFQSALCARTSRSLKMRIRNLSERTVRTYVSLVSRFALFFRRSPDLVGLPEIEQYLFFLRDVKKVSYSLFNQTVCALRFFYLHVMDRPDWVVRIPPRPPREALSRRSRHWRDAGHPCSTRVAARSRDSHRPLLRRAPSW